MENMAFYIAKYKELEKYRISTNKRNEYWKRMQHESKTDMVIKCIEGEIKIDLSFYDNNRWKIMILTEGTEYEIPYNMKISGIKNLTEKTIIEIS